MPPRLHVPASGPGARRHRRTPLRESTSLRRTTATARRPRSTRSTRNAPPATISTASRRGVTPPVGVAAQRPSSAVVRGQRRERGRHRRARCAPCPPPPRARRARRRPRRPPPAGARRGGRRRRPRSCARRRRAARRARAARARARRRRPAPARRGTRACRTPAARRPRGAAPSGASASARSSSVAQGPGEPASATTWTRARQQLVHEHGDRRRRGIQIDDRIDAGAGRRGRESGRERGGRARALADDRHARGPERLRRAVPPPCPGRRSSAPGGALPAGCRPR